MIPVLEAFNVNIKSHFQDWQTGRTEYIIQINFEVNLLNLFNSMCTLYYTKVEILHNFIIN